MSVDAVWAACDTAHYLIPIIDRGEIPSSDASTWTRTLQPIQHSGTPFRSSHFASCRFVILVQTPAACQVRVEKVM